MFKPLDQFSRNAKRATLIAIDFIALPAALWAGFAIRIGDLWPKDIEQTWWLFIAAPLVAVPIFVKMGLYRAVLRYVGTAALVVIVKAITITTLILLALVEFFDTHHLPRSELLSFWLISLLFVGGSRLLSRSYIQRYDRREKRKQIVAVYGAGVAGALLTKAMQSGWEFEPVALFDDDKDKHGTEIHGIKVYPPVQIPYLIDKLGISQILLAVPSVSHRQRHKILEQLEKYQIHIRTLPGITDLVSGKAKVSDIREVDTGDVLGRDVVPPIPELIEKCVRNKNVMVTGAGGSIGSELCRQIVEYGPSRLILFEQSEYALYNIDKELEAVNRDVEVIAILGSVVDGPRMEMLLRSFSVQTVYHAAAYKHVPLVEKNPVEGVQNNILGTKNTAEAAMKAGVESFVLISTDKAVRPTNIMGATKRFAELILQGLTEISETTRFTMVRFGNVLESSGSVIPLFRKQISRGGPITVTHPDVTRFFMTIPEAAQLVMQAGALGEGGDVFVLDMGEPIKIDDLARTMVHLSGLEVCDEQNPDGDIRIEYIGLRPGEKLYEELLIGDNVSGSKHPKIMRADEEKIPLDKVSQYITDIEIACLNYDTNKLKNLLLEVISGYSSSEGIVDPVWNQILGKDDENRARAEGNRLEGDHPGGGKLH